MKNTVIISLLAATALAGCTADIPTVSLGIDDVYYVRRMQKLPLSPALSGRAYRWTVNGREVADTPSFIFLQADEGVYDVRFEIIDPDTPFVHDFTVHVVHEDIEYSPYISEVYEYRPAPGQFVNEMPRYDEGDTEADMIRKATESISGTNDIMVSLGGFGGYITFGFDHTVVNVPGRPDFRIWGNAFYELTDPGTKGGSAEPGIVMVSYDVNCNGLPDDPWYELAGSGHSLPATRPHYSITYRRPDPNRVIEGDGSGFITDINYITWSDSEGTTGSIPKNSFHTQEYYPRWIADDAITFTGTRLPDNAVDRYGDGSYFILYCFDYGYVDNHPNDYADLNSFDISRAIDADGNPVSLPGADFVRVYTGVNQYCGWLGETSTELCRAADLHIDLPASPFSN